MGLDVRCLAVLLALLLGCGASRLEPRAAKPLVAKPELAGVRLLVPKPKPDPQAMECTRQAMQEATGLLAILLTQAGFSVSINSNSTYDAVAFVREMTQVDCRITSISLAIEPGAVESVTLGDDEYWAAAMSEAVRRLQDSPHVQALAGARPVPAPSGRTAIAAPVERPAPPSSSPPSARIFAAGTRSSDAYALVIGIEEYRDVPPPTGARFDAVTFRDLALATLGVPEANLRALLDTRATKSDIERQLGWLAANVPDGGKIYFFFAGHGAPSADGKAFLLPYDADAEAIERSGLRLDTVLSELGASKAGEVVAFTDACFSGAGGRSLLPKGARPLLRVKKPSVPSRVVLYAAAQADQISGAAPDAASGLFTATLVRGLGGAQADLDGDGAITLGELERWATPRVEREAKRQSREQRPSLALPAGVSAESLVLARGLPSP